MKLRRSSIDRDHRALLKHDLQVLLQQPEQIESRPCAGCRTPCAPHASRTCTCACAPDCDHVLIATSSEAARYPIEPHIASLVFAFNRLGVTPTYWSCEGHMLEEGKVRRPPQVWFYAQSPIYPKIISELTLKLKAQRKVHNPWHVTVSYTDDHFTTGYNLEPQTFAIAKPNLQSMQQDTLAIAADLQAGVKELARNYLAQPTRKAVRRASD